CKQLYAYVLERLELQRVARGIQEKHRRLLAGLSGEPDVRLDDELDPSSAQSIGQSAPVVHFQDDTAVRHRNAVPVHRVVVGRDPAILAKVRVEMTHELMTVEIEVHPVRIAASFG